MSAAITQSGWGSFMASLLVGAGVLVHDKIKDRREAKKEAKRKSYEKRYQELQDEHKKGQHKATGLVGKDQTGLSHSTDDTIPDGGVRKSHESQRSEDGPSQWVNEANIGNRRSQTGS